MNNKIVESLRLMAKDFADLADAIEEEHNNINSRLDRIEGETCNTRSILRSIGNLLTESL